MTDSPVSPTGEATGEALSLEPAESMALRIARAQIERGDDVTPNVAAMCVVALARLSGDPIPGGSS